MKCPMCFHDLPPAPAVAVCVEDCPETRAPVDEIRGYPVYTRNAMTIDTLPPWICSVCEKPTSQEACQRCAFPIPPQLRDPGRNGAPRAGKFIAMAGARATGKSVLIATMIQQFKLLCERFYHSPLTPVGTTADRFTRYYLEPLYKARQPMRPTPELSNEEGNPTREPLIFSYQEFSREGLEEKFLVIRDVAGEDLERLAQKNPKAFGFFGRADGVIALIDPLKVPEIRQRLAGTILVPEQGALGGEDIQILRDVISLLVASPRPPVLGVALSKFDTLQKLSEVNTVRWPEIMGRLGSPMLRDPSLQGSHYNLDDGDLLHHELIGLLHELRATSTYGMIANSGLKHRFFATSALGTNPVDATRLNPIGIAPFRVLDPLKWVLDGALEPHLGQPAYGGAMNG